MPLVEKDEKNMGIPRLIFWLLYINSTFKQILILCLKYISFMNYSCKDESAIETRQLMVNRLRILLIYIHL